METSRMMSFLWDKIVKKSTWSANITTKENELIVTLKRGKIGKTFTNSDEMLLKSEISSFMQLS